MRACGEEDLDGILGANDAGFEHDGEHAGAGESGAGVKAGLHETGAETIHEFAGRSKVGELDQCRCAETKARAVGQGAEGEATRGDVFPELAGEDGLRVWPPIWLCEEGIRVGGRGRAGECLKELGLEEMYLGEVGRGGVLANEVAVADGGAAVSVALHAKAGEQVDGGLGKLGEGVGRAAVDGDDGRHRAAGVRG